MVRALLVIDVQNDFTEGGALGVDGGAAVAASITTYLRSHPDRYQVVIASRDWHNATGDNGGHFALDSPPDFVDSWPPHCVAETPGANYHPALDTSLVDIHLKKGQGVPAYSIFQGVGDDAVPLAATLDHLGVTDIDVVGIATDYCVRASALDALASRDPRGEPRRVRVLADLVAGVAASTSVAALAELEAAGAEVVPSDPSRAAAASTTLVGEEAVLAAVPGQLFIGGAWVDASGGARFDVTDPSTGLVIKSIADATAADAQRAMDAAADAQASWGATAPRVRAELLRRAFDLLQVRADDFALLMTLEMGKPLAEARGEVSYGGEFLRWFSEEAVRITGRYGINPEGTGRTIVTHLPVGPSYLITPWNFPLAMATRKIAPALAAGCTVVIKPAELTPLTTLAFVRLLEEAGLPAGVVNVITSTDSKGVSAPILADSRLRKLSFTGSTAVGVSLLKQAADNVLRTSMELGGNAPFIVFADADLDAAVNGAMIAKFRNIGQACTAANRFIVHESIATEFAERVTARVRELAVGRGTDAGVSIGPLINTAAVAKADELVRDAVHRGATVLTGGARLERAGSFYAPTVLTDVRAGSDILRQEIFGPVLSIVTFTDEADAVAKANDTEFGLVGYVFTNDFARGQRMMESLQTGMMGLNVGVVSNASAPFGGVKQSGVGREGGAEGIHEYLETKYILTPDPFV